MRGLDHNELNALTLLCSGEPCVFDGEVYAAIVRLKKRGLATEEATSIKFMFVVVATPIARLLLPIFRAEAA